MFSITYPKSQETGGWNISCICVTIFCFRQVRLFLNPITHINAIYQILRILSLIFVFLNYVCGLNAKHIIMTFII